MVSTIQLEELATRRKLTKDMDASGTKRHQKGLLTARERIDLLVDPGTFDEFDSYMESIPPKFGKKKGCATQKQAVITGTARIDERQVYLYAQDFTVEGGAVGEREARKICKIIDLAIQNGKIIIGLNDAAGARVSEGIRDFSFWNIFQRNVRASGVIPQISAILGPCAGGSAYSPALSDFIFMVQDVGHMFVTGPAVINAVTSETVTMESLGGAQTHTQKSGVAHFRAKSEQECMIMIKELISYLPDNNRQSAPDLNTGDNPHREDEELAGLVPENPRSSYDMRKVILRVVDSGKFFEVQSDFAPNILIGFARLDGKSVGIVANQTRYLAGCLDINASVKAARFIRFCDAFNIPLVSLVDVPGYLPGVNQEHGGILRHGAKMLFAYAEATVPKIVLILRKAYGGAISGMCVGHENGADEILAWPSAELAALGAEGSVDIFFSAEIKTAPDPKQRRQELIEEFQKNVTGVYAVAATGRIEKIIDPKETRSALIRAFHNNNEKQDTLPWKKHGSIPL